MTIKKVEKPVCVLEKIDFENIFERYSRVLVEIRLSQNSTKTRWNKLNQNYVRIMKDMS